MRIGILTFCNSRDNYGQVLQCFALQEFLRKAGHEPFLIRYREDRTSGAAGGERKSVLRYLKHFGTYYHLFQQRRKEAAYYREEAKHDRNFRSFIEEHIAASPIIYDRRTITERPPEADAYICGSDQIWGGDAAYYLDFVPKGKKKIAYAPSFGGVSNFTPTYREQVRTCLEDFAFIGMREESGVQTCRDIGRSDAIKVCDPTLLLSKEDYFRLLPPKNNSEKPYILLYLLGAPTNLNIKDLYKKAAQRGLDVKYVAAQGQYDAFPKTYPSITSWLRLIRDAEMVITNSFHGTVFSLICSRPFMTVPLTRSYQRMNTRITDFLTDTGFINRIGEKPELSNLTKWDFSTFRSYQQPYTVRCGEKLLQALGQ